MPFITNVINADDFGKSREVNRAILEAFEKKLITRTTLMVNMPYADEAVNLAKEYGFSDQIGIHLNLTEGKPLTESIRRNPLFCNKDGYFHARFHSTLKHRLYMNRQAVEHIYEELEAQLEKYKKYGLELWHIDSHHHVHTDYPVYCALKRLSRNYQFFSIRISRNLYLSGNVFMHLYKYIYNSSIKKICKQTTDFFGSYQDYVDYISKKTLPKKSKVEIMVHPMYNADKVLMDTDLPMKEEKFLKDLQ